MRLAWVTLAAMVGCSGAAGASLGPVGDDPGVDAGGATAAMAQQRGGDAEVDAIDAGGGDPPAADANGGLDAGVRADAGGEASADGTSGDAGSNGDATIGGDGSEVLCKEGVYRGQFDGLYSSSLTVFGIDIPMTGNLQLTLQQEGTGQATCTVQGESELCSDVFSLQDGTITGTADGLFPFYCSMTGTLECKEKELVGGWIQCVYCTGTLADAGAPDGGLPACSSGCSTCGGHFAGPLTADYFYGVDGGVPSFGTQPPPNGDDPGAWNGAESLAGYSGTGPLPDGGTLGDYLSDAGYGMIGVANDFGGDGTWSASYVGPSDAGADAL